jgi:ribosomal protein S30
LSDEIVVLAGDILGMSQPLKTRGLKEFVRGKAQQQTPIIQALQLTDEEVAALVAAEEQAQAAIEQGLPSPHVWDYDTRTATVEDLTRRRNLLKNRKRVLEYLRVH